MAVESGIDRQVSGESLSPEQIRTNAFSKMIELYRRREQEISRLHEELTRLENQVIGSSSDQERNTLLTRISQIIQEGNILNTTNSDVYVGLQDTLPSNLTLEERVDQPFSRNL